MKKVFSLLVIILSLLLVLSVFSACGDSQNNTSGNNMENNTGNEMNDEKNDSEENDEPVLDAKTAKPIEIERNTLVHVGIDWPQFNPDSENPMVYEFFLENYDATIEQIVTGNAEFFTKTAALIMAGESPDIVNAGSMFPQIVIQDIIQPVDNVLTITEPALAHLEGAWELYKFKGNHYLLPWLVLHNDDILYNTQMFEEAALDTPKELYEKGEWNWNTFRDAAIELTQDIDGDGAIDVHGVGFTGWHESFFVHSTGVPLASLNDDGTITSNLKDPNLARAFTFLVDLFKVDEVAVLGGIDLLDSGQVAMYQGPFFWHGNPKNLIEGNIVRRAPLPRDPEADDYYHSGNVIGFHMAKGADAPRLVEAFIYSCVISNLPKEPGTDEYEEAVQASMEFRPTWTREEIIEYEAFFEEYNRDIIPVVDFIAIPGQVDIQAIFSRMYNLDTPYATVVEEMEPVFEGFIDELLQSE